MSAPLFKAGRFFYEVDPLVCPEYGADMRIIAFIEEAHPKGLWIGTDRGLA